MAGQAKNGTASITDREPGVGEMVVGEAVHQAGGDAREALHHIRGVIGGVGNIKGMIPNATIPQRKAIADALKRVVDRELGLGE